MVPDEYKGRGHIKYYILYLLGEFLENCVYSEYLLSYRNLKTFWDAPQIEKQ